MLVTERELRGVYTQREGSLDTPSQKDILCKYYFKYLGLDDFRLHILGCWVADPFRHSRWSF